MKMTNKPHDDGCTACVRRLYLHARDGGRVSVLDMAQIVRWMEQKDQEIADLRAENKRLRKALEWYADPTFPYVITQIHEPRSAVHADGGHRAREALAAGGEEC